MNNVVMLVFALSAISLVGCAPKNVLKQEVIDKHGLSYEDVSSIQFYNSQDIVLTNYEPVKSEKSTNKGSLNVNFDKEVDQVIIKRGTKGRIVKDLGNKKYAVSFEPDESKVLVFGVQTRFNVYYLQALEWENGRGKIQYGDKVYFTNSGANECTLLFKINKSLKEDKEMRVAKGNKVK